MVSGERPRQQTANTYKGLIYIHIFVHPLNVASRCTPQDQLPNVSQRARGNAPISPSPGQRQVVASGCCKSDAEAAKDDPTGTAGTGGIIVPRSVEGVQSSTRMEPTSCVHIDACGAAAMALRNAVEDFLVGAPEGSKRSVHAASKPCARESCSAAVREKRSVGRAEWGG